MLTSHRWMPGPPIPERLARLAENLGALADAVRDAGITLGMENHCDFRGHEIASVIQQADRPNLRVQLDTGNAFSVFEEPVEAREMAGRARAMIDSQFSLAQMIHSYEDLYHQLLGRTLAVVDADGRLVTMKA